MRYSTPEEVHALFQETWNNLEFISREVPYRKVELIFHEADEARKFATETNETQK